MVRTTEEKLKIIDFIRKFSKKKAKRKFKNLSNGQMQQYMKKEEEYRQEVEKGKNKDKQRNRKRKGRPSLANERRAKKKQRVGKAGFDRSEQYQWLDRICLAWFCNARQRGFAVTPRMVQMYASVELQLQKNEQIQNVDYWYRSFREANDIVVRRITGLRRKVYTPEKLASVTINWRGFIRKWKLKRGYLAELIINMDEIPLYMDMCRGWTLSDKGAKSVDVNHTNSDRLRFTGFAAVAANGTKLDFSVIFRTTNTGRIPPALRQYEHDDVKIFCNKKGWMDEVMMLRWIEEVLKPYLEENGGGSDGRYAFLFLDPAKSHLTERVREKFAELRVDLAVMPASTTYKFQLIDVAIGKAFKDSMYEGWTKWMLEQNDSLGLTRAGNRKHPTLVNCVEWADAAWKNISADTIRKAAKKTYMTADPGPEIEGYQDEEVELREDEDELVEQDIE